MSENVLKAEDVSRIKIFVQEAVTSEKIYVIMGPDGAAGSFSTNYFDENNDHFPLIPFWTDSYLTEARSCVVENGDEFQIIYIPLLEFVESWLPGMNEDEVIVGLNWTDDMTGPEIMPMDLLEMIMDEMDEETRCRLDRGNSAA